MKIDRGNHLSLYYCDLVNWSDPERGRFERYTEEMLQDPKNFSSDARIAMAYAVFAGFKVHFVSPYFGEIFEVDTDKNHWHKILP